jgi:hypothetical protein
MGEHPSTPNDEINLILCVRRLLGGAQGKGKGYIQRATPKDDDGVLARWDTRLGLDKTENMAALGHEPSMRPSFELSQGL